MRPLKGSAQRSAEQYAALPESLSIRVLRLRLERNRPAHNAGDAGHHTARPCTDSKQSLADLFAQRWQIELNFDDLKTTLGMEHLACKSPAMVERTLQVCASAYNLIRALMLESAVAVGVPLGRLSFKGSGRALALWSANLRSPRAGPRHRAALWDTLLAVVATDLLPCRPDRHERRAVKRRPKNHPLLTKQRHEFQTIAHRNRCSNPPKNKASLS